MHVIYILIHNISGIYYVYFSYIDKLINKMIYIVTLFCSIKLRYIMLKLPPICALKVMIQTEPSFCIFAIVHLSCPET